MPKITIREEDLTSAGVTNVTTNAVYIPGYAVMGPVNTPTLCESLADFQSIFGTSPYIFRETQTWESIGADKFTGYIPSNSNFAEAGDAEKSYIFAAELLKQGLPVLYERVFAGDVTTWSASRNFDGTHGTEPEEGTVMTLRSATPGLVSKDIYCTIEKDTIDIGNQDSPNPVDYYIVSVGRKANADLGTSAVSKVSTKFTLDAQLSKQYDSIKYYKDLEGAVDNSGLVTFSFVSDIVSIEVGSPETEIEFTLTADTSNDEFAVKDMYTFLSTNGQNALTNEPQGFDRLLDKGEYVIKHITAGAYPVFGYDSTNSIVTTMITTAANRGDAVALIDPTNDTGKSLAALNSNSVYAKIKEYATSPRYNELGEDIYSYGAVYMPYGIYTSSVTGEQVELPGSFAYLIALAVSVQNNPNWYAVAGVTRGVVPNLVALSQNVTNAVADSYTPRDDISINPITNIKPYGLTIWGSRTLKNNARAGDLTATSFMNVRNLVCDVKRTVFVAAKRLTFEQNNDILWINFKAQITPTLEQMLQGNGLTGYELIRQKTTKKATLKAKIVLYCVEPVEDFDITISLTDSETTITE